MRVEEAWAERGVLRSAEATLRSDSDRLSRSSKQLDKAANDARKSREVDEGVLRLRKRSGPGTRLTVRP